MPMTQTTTYKCEQCGATVELPGSMGGQPTGWLQLSVAGTGTSYWFDRWACARDFSTAKAQPAA